MTTTKIIPSANIETQRLIERLRRVAVDEVVTYEELERELGFDPRTRWQTARRRLLVDDGMHFVVVRGRGYTRLAPAAASKTMAHHATRVRRMAHRGLQVAQRIDIHEVPPEERAAFVGRAAYLDIVHSTGLAKNQQKLIDAATVKPDQQLQLRDAFAALQAPKK